MRSGVIPPTGKRCVPFGRTERQALTTSGGMASAGKSFRPDAPELSAAKASVGVATPGRTKRPSLTAHSMTNALAFGATTSLAPAPATRSTSSGERTVPAPTSVLSPKRRAIVSMLFSGSGELSGTSIAPNPASTMTEAIASASLGSIPRRMATSGVGAS